MTKRSDFFEIRLRRKFDIPREICRANGADDCIDEAINDRWTDEREMPTAIGTRELCTMYEIGVAVQEAREGLVQGGPLA